MADLGSIGGIVGNLAGTMGKIILIVAVAAAGFFGTKYFKKFRAKRKLMSVTAFISNPDGSHYVDYIGKVKDKDGLDKMMFKIHKTDTCPVISPKYIVNKSIHLFRYGPGEFAIIPPVVYRTLDPTKFNIQLISQNMLAFKGMEQRAAITRWQTNKDRLQQWLPWITIIICVGCALGAIYLTGQTASQLIMDGMAARTTDCSTIIPVDTITKAIVSSLKEANTNGVVTTIVSNVTKPI